MKTIPISTTNSRTFWLKFDFLINDRNTYGFAHAKIQKSIFDPKILELLDVIGIILNDFQSWFYSITKIWVRLIRK